MTDPGEAQDDDDDGGGGDREQPTLEPLEVPESVDRLAAADLLRAAAKAAPTVTIGVATYGRTHRGTTTLSAVNTASVGTMAGTVFPISTPGDGAPKGAEHQEPGREQCGGLT